MPAVFSYDAQTGPQYVDLNGIAAGYGVISVPIDGFLTGDQIQTVGLTITGTGLATIQVAVDMVMRTGGYYEWTAADAIDAHFTMTSAQIAAIGAASNCQYSIAVMILRNGVQQTREVQAGNVSARATSPTPPLVVNSITLTGGPVSGSIGGQAQLTATCRDGFGNVLPSATVTWTSGNPNIASVDASGKVTFIIPGTATITASSQGVAASTTATVSDPGLVAPTANQVVAWDAGQSNWLPKTLTSAFLSIAVGALVVGGGWPSGATELAPGAAAGYVRSNGAAWVRQSGVPASDITAGTFGAGAYSFPSSLTIGSGLTVTAGTSALQAVTATTVNASSGFTGNVTGNVTGNATTATALATGRTIAITGDLSYTSPVFDGSGNVTAAGTLATVNANVGSFGGSTAIPVFTVNGKGLITAASTAVVIAPAGTLSGTTLAANVVTSSLTSVGVLVSPHMTGVVVDSGGLTVTLGTTAVQAITATTGVFSGTVSTGALTASSATIAGTVSTGALTSTTGSFSGAVSMAGLSATTGAFSSTLTVASTTTLQAALGVTGLATLSGGATIANGQTLTLTGVTITGAPTWSSNQAITLSTAAQPNVTSVGTLTSLTVGGTITMTPAASQLIPGATSFSVRNNANTLDNMLITDAGAVTTRSTLTVTAGGLTVSAGTTALQAVTATSVSTTGVVNIAALSALQFGGTTAISNSSTYNILNDSSGVNCIHLGNTGDAQNYYSNTGHIFRARNGGAAMLSMGAGALNIFTPVTILNAASAEFRMTGSATNQTITQTFYDNNATTLKGRLLYGGGNGPGARYFGLINDAADSLSLWTLNATPIVFLTNGFTRASIDGTTGAFVLGTDPGGAELLRVGGTARFGSTVTIAAGGLVVAATNVPLYFNNGSSNIRVGLHTGTAIYYGNIDNTGNTALNLLAGGSSSINFIANNSVWGSLDSTGHWILGTDTGGSELVRVGGDIRTSGSIVLNASTSANSGMRVDTSGTTRFKGTDKTILNNGVTSALSDGPVGWLRVTTDDNEGAEYFIRGGGHSVTKMSESAAGIFTVTAGNAGTINVYWDAGNLRYSIENKRGGTRVCTMEFIGQ